MSKKKKAKKVPETFGAQIISWAKTIIGAIIVVMIINGILIASFVVPTGSMEDTVATGDFLFVNKFIYGPTTPQVIPFVNIPLPFYKFPAPSDPEKGDVIVFIYPGDRNDVEPDAFQYFLKRCVATAGDTLQIVDNQLYVNGKAVELAEEGKFVRRSPAELNATFNTFPPNSGYSISNYGPVVIPYEGMKIDLDRNNYEQWRVFIGREGHEISYRGNDVVIDGEAVSSYTVERNYCFGMGDNRNNSQDSRAWGYIPYENVVGTPMIVYWSWDTSLPMSEFFGKLASVRFDRIGTIIR
jgi:signal peptidase I